MNTILSREYLCIMLRPLTNMHSYDRSIQTMNTMYSTLVLEIRGVVLLRSSRSTCCYAYNISTLTALHTTSNRLQPLLSPRGRKLLRTRRAKIPAGRNCFRRLSPRTVSLLPSQSLRVFYFSLSGQCPRADRISPRHARNIPQ